MSARARFLPICPFGNGLKTSLIVFVLTCSPFGFSPAQAQVTAYKQAIAEAAWTEDAIAAFYRANNYTPIWTGEDDAARHRRAALLDVLADPSIHALPQNRYDVPGLMQKMRAARTTRDLGLLEVELSRVFLAYAGDVQSGMLIPSRIDDGLKRKVERRDGTELLNQMAAGDPYRVMAALPPQTREYQALSKARLKLDRVIADGGWGATVPAGAMEPGQTGERVVALRNRLQRMGYMGRSATRTYDAEMERAVADFQRAHGLEADGVAGKGTVSEINVPARDRMKSVMVAMERERWLNKDLGQRHILVNLADFHAKIIDDGAVTFQTRSVVGKNVPDRRSPEFSDVMEHMIINPSWYVPRSIIVKEYLPALRRNPNAVRHLEITDSRGRRINRSSANFSANARIAMRQPPGPRNALGLVKFMFPNKYNIYLHDTPQKALFKKEVRAYSHGCIRLAQPFDFAYALLALQQDDPKTYFDRIRRSGKETKVVLEKQVPVHLIYRTAQTTVDGRLEFRRDVYGRDAKIWRALAAEGVVLNDVQG